MPPEKHALLSASSASRWLKCTAAPRFEEHLPERTSEYAEEGRLAHSICELKTLKKFTVMTSRTYTTRLNKLKKDPLYSEEMDKTSDLYIEHLIEQAMLYDSTPTVVKGEIVAERYAKAMEAKAFFMSFLSADCAKIAVENPTPLKIVELSCGTYTAHEERLASRTLIGGHPFV